MKRLIFAAALATTALSPTLAYDTWNGSGFPLDHNFHSPYDAHYGYGVRPSGPQIITVPKSRPQRPRDYDDKVRDCPPYDQCTPAGAWNSTDCTCWDDE
jgi:hypothetical protein